MKLAASLALFAAFLACAPAQKPDLGGRSFVRILVQHGDPWAIKALIEGTPIVNPELSTILGFAGIPDKDSALIESLFGGKGRLVVNPTDNSLLFFPAKS